MSYCDHVRGLYGSMLVSETNWKYIAEKAEDRLNFYNDNFKNVHLYQIQAPPNLIEFKFCPFCGERV